METEIKSYNFSTIKYSDLEDIVNITPKLNNSKFDDWFQYHYAISENEITFLDNLLKKHYLHLSSYFEDTLKIKFIGPILNQVDFTAEYIQDWYHASLGGEVNGVEIKGFADYMVATGTREPHKPYFFIQEFKPSIPDKDPEIQLLAELLEEVKLKFIGNLISLVDFDTENLSAFAERELSGTVDGEELSGFPDLMVARGKQEVDAPFFFLHEYKKELDNNSPDPAGQCLAAMLLAYEKNRDVPQMAEQPIYGTYVVGRQWFFVVLKDREYGISDSYASTHKDELLDILRIMKAARQKIREIWGE